MTCIAFHWVVDCIGLRTQLVEHSAINGDCCGLMGGGGGARFPIGG